MCKSVEVLIYGQLLCQRVFVEPRTFLRIHLKDITHNPTGAVFATDLLCCDKRGKKKEVMDLTNRGLYFITDRSASAPQTEMLSHLHSVQARTEQGVEQIQKKRKMIGHQFEYFSFVGLLPSGTGEVSRLSDETGHRVRDIKMSYCKRHNCGIRRMRDVA